MASSLPMTESNWSTRAIYWIGIETCCWQSEMDKPLLQHQCDFGEKILSL